MPGLIGTAFTGDNGRMEGGEWVGVITCLDEDGVAVDISASTEISFCITYSIGNAALLTKLLSLSQITKAEGDEGKFVVTIQHTDTILDTGGNPVTGRLAYEAYVTIGGNRWLAARNYFDHHATKY